MAKKNPSTRWFFHDWHNDEAVQVCSLAARGVWIELLGPCQANGGYLLINDKAPSVAALARYVGATPAVMRRLLKELEDNGVFSRTPEGVIFNRRMVRANDVADHKTSKGPNREHDPNQAELFDDEPFTHVSASDKASKPSGLSQESYEPDSETPSREDEKINTRESFERPAGAFGDVDLGAKTRMPARVADRHRDGGCDGQTSQAPASDNRDLARECQDHANPIAGGGQSATVGLSRPGFPKLAASCPSAYGEASSPSTRLGAFHGGDFRPARAARPRSPPKSPALKAKIREQLQQKHQRFLVATAPDLVGDYWDALNGDDAAVAQTVFDLVDRRMRAAHWDEGFAA